MPVSVEDSKITYDCNGTTTEFDFVFPCFGEDDIEVTIRDNDGNETVLTITTEYTVASTDNDYRNGGTVTTIATYDSTYTITIARVLEYKQPTDLEAGGKMPAQTLDDTHDRTVMQLQQVLEMVQREIRIPITDPSTINMELPPSVERANHYLKFNSDGEPVVIAEIETSGVTISPFSKTLLDDADAPEWLGTLGFTTFTKSLRSKTDAGEFMTALGFTAFFQGLVDDVNAGDMLGSMAFSAFSKSLRFKVDAGEYLTAFGFSTWFQGIIDASDKSAFITETDLDLDDIPDGTFRKVHDNYVDVSGYINAIKEVNGARFKCKIIEIGDWNMDTTNYVDVDHNLTQAKIRGAQVIIRSDIGDEMLDLAVGISQTGEIAGGYGIGELHLRLYRVASGYFDSVDFDSTSYNRGWIYIWYEA